MIMIHTERKHSRKRDAILRVIQSTTAHPSARQVYDVLKPSIPDLSLGTVYRNINLFQGEGAVVSLGVVDGEERFDGCVAPHPHVVCCRCGRVADLPCPGGEGRETGQIEGPEASRVGTNNREDTEGFVIDYRKTVYYGLCPDCAGERGF
ncbi:MAG: transcriptional repressor [Spirochaetaceae bacterium]|jgi:Fur family peroxide stress response transcriptional regulator|nr:transcriptional repressor [Spirochaetaceae bacterium]